MDIDLTSIIIGIVALSFFFIPIIYYELSKKKSSKKVKKQFFDLAKDKAITINQHDIWRDAYAIGIDTDSRKLLYLNKQDTKDEQILVDLTEIAKASRSVKRSAKKADVTDRVNVTLTFQNPNKAEKALEFFRSANHPTLQDEVALAEKWADIINANLS